MEVKRERVTAFLGTKVPIPVIIDKENFSCALIYKAKAMVNAGNSFMRKEGSGGHNKKLTENNLAKIQSCRLLAVVNVATFLPRLLSVGLQHIGQFKEKGMLHSPLKC